MTTTDPLTNARVQADALTCRFGIPRFPIAVICGSGVSKALAHLGDLAAVPMVGIGLPTPRVSGHRGEVYAWQHPVTPVLVLGGRVHAYEGYGPNDLAAGVRLAAACGAETLIVTNAAGSIRREWAPGTFVTIADHIDLTGVDPLAELDFSDGTSRFTDMTDAYSAHLRASLRAVRPEMPEGVYAARRGPSYETPAEIRALAALGADLAGMSTTWEVVAARHAGMAVLGISLVTNLAAGLSTSLDHAEVTATGHARAEAFAELLGDAVTAVGTQSTVSG